MSPTSVQYDNAVFINCPFDDDYLPLLHAIVFSIYRCGFIPVTALGEDNALDNRLLKIQRCIAACRYGIHDLSRAEINSAKLPRFNMPFELGLFFGASYFGNKQQKAKNALVFDSDRFRYQQFISDLNGVDIKAHENNPKIAIRKIRDWLSVSSRRKSIPDHAVIQADYQTLINRLAELALRLRLSVKEISFNDFCMLTEEMVREVT